MAAIAGKRSATFIDMTPMVDLAFLLLTFFVLTSNLMEPWVLKIDMPLKEGDRTKELPQNRALTLVLDKENKIHWYSGVDIDHAQVTDFSSEGIRKVLVEKKATVKDLYVLIKPSDKSQYKNVVDILDEMIITEIKHYTIVDLDPLDRELISNR